MYITKSERFALFDQRLYFVLKTRARAERDKTTIRMINSLFLPVAKRVRGQTEVDLSPRSLWMWNKDITNGLQLVGVGDVVARRLKELVGDQRV